MVETTEYARSLRNGKNDLHITALSGTGLGNTNPVATRGSTLGPGVPSSARPTETTQPPRVRLTEPERINVLETRLAAGGHLTVEANVLQRANVPKPAGQVVLFKSIMKDWAFNESEAAMVLGFETASDIVEIYTGIRPLRQRDANDRLRAVLRIATDLDALFGEVTAIQDWLSEPQRDLGGAAPRSLLVEGSMENLLLVKSYVAYLSGR